MTDKSNLKKAREILEKVLAVSPAICKLQLCLASTRKDNIPDFQRVVITDSVVCEFQDIILKFLKKYTKEMKANNLILHKYEASTKLDSHEVEFLNLAEFSEVKKQIGSLANIPGLAKFESDEDFIENLRFYVLILKCEKLKPIYFFRTYTPKRELSRSSFMAIIFDKNQYEKVTDSLLLFDKKIDCIYSDGYLFIKNKANFQRIFEFYSLLIKSAKQTLRAIKENIPIDNFTAFSKACEGHLLKLAKLKNIASKPYFEKLKMSDIKTAIKKYNLDIKTVGSGKGEKIHFDSSDKWGILKLLDDDYLDSIMTGSSYEVNSKRLRST
ncbi:MAG: hypothetical protein BBJ57_05995 [Desulfobacterales bacterium PC51MH44]|nr:MAG: hypothetical protein BBJ57_05995 [Desulfobacterales bacterium PC51MH44]